MGCSVLAVLTSCLSLLLLGIFQAFGEMRPPDYEEHQTSDARRCSVSRLTVFTVWAWTPPYPQATGEDGEVHPLRCSAAAVIDAYNSDNPNMLQ